MAHRMARRWPADGPLAGDVRAAPRQHDAAMNKKASPATVVTALMALGLLLQPEARAGTIQSPHRDLLAVHVLPRTPGEIDLLGKLAKPLIDSPPRRFR